MQTDTALIFDFDGVIVYSEPVHQRAWLDVAAAVGAELPPNFLHEGIGFFDAGLTERLARVWKEQGKAPPPPERLLEMKRQAYQRRSRAETQFIAGAQEALAFFAARHPLGLATSSCLADIAPHIEESGLSKHFKTVLTIESIERPKPHPEIYVKAARLLGVPPERCWVFEDSVQGATAARAAGARVIGMTTTLSAEVLAPIEAAFKDFSSLEAIHALIRKT